MALKSRTYACEACDGQFTILKDDRDPPPAHCACCGASTGDDPEPILNFSAIGKAKNKTPDTLYRKMEAASVERAQMAADMAGVPVSEMSALKMTNQKDNLRQGDTSFMAPSVPRPSGPPPMPSNVRPIDGQAGLATAQMIRSQGGSVGHGVMAGLKQSHNQRAAQMQRAGQMGSFSGK